VIKIIKKDLGKTQNSGGQKTEKTKVFSAFSSSEIKRKTGPPNKTAPFLF
jgi:hypothetical protein